MPYTIDELQTLDFYVGYRNNLRAQHIDKLVSYALNKFRDSNNVLYSFEAIERDPELGIGMGIENSNLLRQSNGPYAELSQYLSKVELIAAGIIDEDEIEFLDDFEFFVKDSSKSKQLRNSYPEYDRGTLNSVVDRSFSELITLATAERLPEGISNGDILTRKDATDYRKWLIDGNQKRIFASGAAFYGENFNYTSIKSVTDVVLDKIPPGEPVE